MAARKVNKDLTGSIFRALIARDPEFARQVEEAEVDGLHERQELVRAAIQRRALNVDDRSTRALEIMAATLLPEYGWLRLRGGSNGHGPDDDPLSMPLVKTELLTDGQLEQLVHLIEMGQGKKPNPELQNELAERRGLPPAVVDAPE